ncbi:MAG TPA: glycosyltransferase [Elusimicrobiota bacterium]|nr:glycosyltransferase [Elusimicrobiota bacterium]
MDPEIGRPRLIWIVPKFPLGAPDGARYATAVLLRHLATLSVDIELICLAKPDDEVDPAAACAQLGVTRCTRVPRGSGLIPFAPWRTPLTFRTFAAAKVRRELSQALAETQAARRSQAAWVVFDGLHGAAALTPSAWSFWASAGSGFVYRAHNFETALWEQCVAESRTPWTRRLVQYQASLVKAFERSVAERAAWVAPVSDEDERRFKTLAPGVRTVVTRIGWDFPSEEEVRPVEVATRGLQLFFIGRLDWLPNRKGLVWFLEQVWPAVNRNRPDARLVIAGTGDAGWLEPYRRLPAVRWLGRVDQLEPLYRSCALTIAPLFQGSGMRVKIVEAARYARPTISTALGAEGSTLIPGDSFYRAESAADWITLLSEVTLDECRDTGWQAFRRVKRTFDAPSIARTFLAAFSRRPE